MIFHENRLPSDNSHKIYYFIFFENGETWKNLVSAAVVIGALRVKHNCTVNPV